MNDQTQYDLSYAALGLMLMKKANPRIKDKVKLEQAVDAKGNKVFIKHTRKTKKGEKVTETPLLYDPYKSRNKQKVRDKAA